LVILALLAMWIGVLRYTGSLDAAALTAIRLGATQGGAQ